MVVKIEPRHGILQSGENASLDVDTPRRIAVGRTYGADQSVVEAQRQGELFQQRFEVLLTRHGRFGIGIQRIGILQRRVIQLCKYKQTYLYQIFRFWCEFNVCINNNSLDHCYYHYYYYHYKIYNQQSALPFQR